MQERGFNILLGRGLSLIITLGTVDIARRLFLIGLGPFVAC